MGNKVAIIVVTYNRLKMLQDEIVSLLNQTYKDAQIVVVNNGSNDGTLEWLESQSDIYTITQENLGGAGGFYTGVKYAAENGFKYCWVMDDDVLCEPDALEKLVEEAERTPDIGFLCSRVFAPDKTSSMNVPVIDYRTHDGLYTDWLRRIDEKIIQVRCATFVSVLFPVVRVYELGLPIKDYFIWGDDVEYTKRLSNDHVSYLICDSKVIHRRNSGKELDIFTETNKFRLRFYYYRMRNGMANTRKYDGRKQTILHFFYQLSIIVRLMAKFDFGRLRIAVRGFLAGLFYNPSVEFPVIKAK